MRLKRIAAMLMTAVMAVSLAACGGNADTNTESSQNPQESTEAQAVHLNLAESWGFEYFYTIITPEVSSSSYDITYYLTSFYDTLFEYNSEGEVVGVLAEDWSMSEDGMVYTFQIKQGVKFSDGSDLTAEDVAKSILAVPVNLGQYNGSYPRSPKAERYGALRRCCPTHGSIKAKCLCGSQYLKRRRFSHNGRGSLSPPDRCGPRGCRKNLRAPLLLYRTAYRSRC